MESIQPSKQIILTQKHEGNDCCHDFQSIYLSNYLSIYRSFYIDIFLSISPSISPSTSPSISPSISLSPHLSIYLPISPSIYLSICLSIYLSICLSMNIIWSKVVVESLYFNQIDLWSQSRLIFFGGHHFVRWISWTPRYGNLLEWFRMA